MPTPSQQRTQKLTIVAQDPSVRVGGRILTVEIEVPAEELAPGPRGYRLQVINYDASSGVLYQPITYRVLEDGRYNDPFRDVSDDVLLGDPSFHAQNVYAIAMRILARFEFALGRRVSWSFGGHQLYVAPHAFADANAFYSKHDRALMFGYFPRLDRAGDGDGAQPEMIYSCLSHDVVAHETTHALLDGLRERYTDPSSPEQAGFHEGFADVVALLSVFSLPGIVEQIIDRHLTEEQAPAKGTRRAKNRGGKRPAAAGDDPSRVKVRSLVASKLQSSLPFALGKEMGQQLIGRGIALRESVKLPPSTAYMNMSAYREPHRRGELLVAATMNAMIKVWLKRLRRLAHIPDEGDGDAPAQATGRGDEELETLDRRRVAEEGAEIAEHLLTMSIRALDYCPPTDLQFCDFLSALLTADREIRPNDAKYDFRSTILESFGSYGIVPTSKAPGGVWEPPDCDLHYERVHHESLTRDPDEVFRFIWENRLALGLDEDAFTRVLSVRPCVRVNADDGFVLRETVAEYYQSLTIKAAELKHLGIKQPDGMRDDQQITLYGGGTLIFNEFGRVKYHIRNRILNPERQTSRLKYLWLFGHFARRAAPGREALPDRRFAQMHQLRFASFKLSSEQDYDEYY